MKKLFILEVVDRYIRENFQRIYAGIVDLEIQMDEFQVPQMTTNERNSLRPRNGMVILNTTTNKFQGYVNGSWVDFH